eukprot:CAMPEP_0177596508 /NCGR_PEP_ID=MMETSP0419_2-20121207/11120_1 /TAXON_ID=582737 /ORGANISM="Tetraselmis sp., Strain GSL018" /LENGTH=44 /DNA_ID= /DNA_START= /DNA_END= /DNA_ORIENTATION=
MGQGKDSSQFGHSYQQELTGGQRQGEDQDQRYNTCGIEFPPALA